MVERERGKVALIQDGKLSAEVGDLGDLSHATLKFHRGDAWLVSRDGRLSRIDPCGPRVTATAKVGNSAIGLTFVGDHVAVANYDPCDVVVLDRDLREVRRIPTGSRNVGIKAEGNRLFFALMDRDEIWVVDAARGYALEKTIPEAGAMPFDALLAEGRYVIGLYKESAVGVLDTRSLEYRKIPLKAPDGSPVLKIPHFGMWGVAGRRAFLPMPGVPKLYEVDLDSMAVLRTLELPGQPVFAAVAPDGKTLAVNYSGARENFVSLIDTADMRHMQDLEVGQRVMHLRFSEDSRNLYASTFFDNRVHVLSGQPWASGSSVAVPGPSGLFLAPTEVEP
ncbi:MAG: cytochrome D1 domain-containing protein [Candidatus Eremiobacterota bacterium]